MTEINSQAYVKLTVQENTGIITFFHPQSNSLPGAILSELAETITRAGNDPEIRVIILKSEGEKAFCAGASFDELIAIEDKSTGLAFFSGFARVINACRKAPKFIIGRVQGRAVGGGVGVASAVDYCFATRKAEVKLSELAVGIGPFVVGPAVQRKTGLSAFSQMSINASVFYSAEWAKEKGLYAEVFDTTEEMDTAIEKLATTLSKSNPQAMQMLKNVFWEGTENWDELLIQRAGMSGELVLSDFTRKAIQAFKKK
ncbi:MAG: enoyl-CoA hydratase/isomerase family protein [Bacteroidia bacterium]|nr:enoyl-CoA hydratase/isomerase family protein [Bacteroidia bacterium]